MASAREFGILLHPSSLPGEHGIGDLGPSAFAFADWLHAAGARVWQILPLVPPGAGNSPYSSWSAFSCNPLLISLEMLSRDGLLPHVESVGASSGQRVDFDSVTRLKFERLAFAAKILLQDTDHPRHQEFRAFVDREAWVLDAALFRSIKRSEGEKAWWDWTPALRDREPDALADAREALKAEIDEFCVWQFFFDVQWRELRAYCNNKDIQILGDMPIYVDADSVDVWCNRTQFQLDADGRSIAVAGVPPDAFSDTGQLWGNPLYDWDYMRSDQYNWWVRRLKRGFGLTDRIRIDHFRGLSAYWSVPADSSDARNGRWVEGPGNAFFDAIKAQLGEDLPIVAEDLGTIDDAVVELVRHADVPNMLVLQFAFGGESDNWY
ncbi:MAG: 4-alpha-glucanotransferase, partial [Bradymonadia bacterium]